MQHTSARTMHHMQAFAQIRGRVLCPRASSARVRGQAAPISHVPSAWIAGLCQVPGAQECNGGSEIAVPEGTTKCTRLYASGQPRWTHDPLSGCAPPAALHAHTWSMHAPRTCQPRHPPQNDGDPSHHAPLPPPAPQPCGMMGEGEPEHVSRLLFGAEHGRSSTEIT